MFVGLPVGDGKTCKPALEVVERENEKVVLLSGFKDKVVEDRPLVIIATHFEIIKKRTSQDAIKVLPKVFLCALAHSDHAIQ